VFITQHASRQKTKRNNHQILPVKMRQSDSFESYIGYFKS